MTDLELEKLEERLRGVESRKEFFHVVTPLLPKLIADAKQPRDIRDAVVFDVRATYPRRSIGMSDDAVFEKWLEGVKERGWSPAGKEGET